jgi:glycosyltransferase involved in cell wall biosynthesis
VAFKVAMVGWEFPPFMTGGLAVHCYELTRALAAKGAEIDFFMPKTSRDISVPWMRIRQVEMGPGAGGVAKFGGYPMPLAIAAAQASRSKKNPSPNPGSNPGSKGSAGLQQSYGWSFFDEVARFNYYAAQAIAAAHREEHYDLIHCHDWITAGAGAEASRATGVPLVVTIHSTESDRTAGLWPFEHIVHREIEACENATRVIAVSKRTKQQLVEKYGVPAEKVSPVHNAVSWNDCASGTVGKARAKAMLGLKHDEPVVLFHGRLCIQKGPEFFLRAAKRVLEKEPNARFFVSGGGDMMPRLIEMSFDLGIADRIVFVGQVPLDKVPLVYEASDVYILTSPSEPFGITVLEAMACGTPCVVTPTSGVSEIVASCLHAEYWDVDQIATRVVALLRLPELKQELAENGFREVQRISWDKVAEETLKVYAQVARR